MRVGIVGLPNAGKSTLFNALTASGAEVGSYPFTTVDPNVAQAAFRDERLDAVREATGATEPVPAMVEFVDIAGLVEGAHRGEGLGNQFLHHIRETDAILHVVRCFEDSQVSHPSGSVDPATDVDQLETELMLADLERVEKRLDDARREAKSGEKGAREYLAWLESLAEALRAGNAASTVEAPEGLEAADRELALLTAKPVLLVANVSEDDATLDPSESAPGVAERASAADSDLVAVSAKIEAELAELEEEEADSMRQELGLGSSGLDKVIDASFKLLDLVTFFTGQPGSEARAWHVPKGTVAARAAGKIHGDMERGFIRAEIVPWDKLAEAGSIAAARETGALKVEGHDYLIEDGDVMTVKFSV